MESLILNSAQPFLGSAQVL